VPSGPPHGDQLTDTTVTVDSFVASCPGHRTTPQPSCGLPSYGTACYALGRIPTSLARASAAAQPVAYRALVPLGALVPPDGCLLRENSHKMTIDTATPAPDVASAHSGSWRASWPHAACRPMGRRAAHTAAYRALIAAAMLAPRDGRVLRENSHKIMIDTIASLTPAAASRPVGRAAARTAARALSSKGESCSAAGRTPHPHR
jgi:hypothetical protein